MSLDTRGLDWFYGVGRYFGSCGPGYGHDWWDDNHSHTAIGVDGIIDLEYKFDIPINRGLDWKPALSLTSLSGFRGKRITLFLPYTFR